MKHTYKLSAMVALMLSITAAYAQTGYPTSKPASAAVSTAPGTASSSERWTDKNGDGIIQRDEVLPGSQIDKRFKTRDKNNDGQLTSDEYFPPK